MLKLTEFPRRFVAMHKRALSRAMPTAMHPSVSRCPASTLQALLPNAQVVLRSRKMTTKAPSRPFEAPSLQIASLSTASHPETATESDPLLGERDDSWFTTSRDPRSDPTFPGRDPRCGRLSSIAMLNLRTCSREDVLDYFDNSWALTDAIFATLQGERAFLTPPPHQLRHPLIFYYGHPTVFYVNKCVVAGLLKDAVNPYFEHIFEVGVDEMRWDDMSKNEMQWPSVADVTAYRHQVYGIIRKLIETHPGLDPGHAQIDEHHPLWALCMGLEHERIHLETTSVLIQEHPLEFFHPSNLLAEMHESAQRTEVARHPVAGKDYPVNEFLAVPSATVTIGKPRSFPSFGWDNEYGSKQVQVPACDATKYLISNGEFSEFVRSGGYLEPKFWSATGWSWRCFRNTKWPQFWVPDGPAGSHQYRLRTMFQVIPMQWDWPAQVNFHEAQAYCKWKNVKDGNRDRVAYHLTTEPVHQLLRDHKDRSDETSSDDILHVRNSRMADDQHKNLNFSYTSFSPVDAMRPTETGFHDVFGNAWEWCEDCFAPLPGFSLHPYYDDFSAPCFDGEHQIIMGGSYMSTGDNGAAKFARYHFRPHFFQHAGFRVVSQPINAKTNTIRLATTCVNAPGPYAKPHPFRTSEVVAADSEAGPSTANDESKPKDHESERFLRDVEDKSNAMLQAFVASLGADAKVAVVRVAAEAELRRVAGDTAPDATLVVVSDLDVQHVAAVLEPHWQLVQTRDVPIVTSGAPRVVQLRIQAASVWRPSGSIPY